MSEGRDLIVTSLLSPETTRHLSSAEWDLLIRQGRRANLLGRLAHLLTGLGSLEAIPHAPRQHLSSALLLAQRQESALRREVEHVLTALAGVDAKVTLLKGAAYVVAGLDVAYGRTFSDIDILVPKAALEHAEVSLQMHGWHGTHHDDYDQRYYRQWMHEIPPMRHFMRGTTIDLHHTILPETARIQVNTPALLDAVVPVSGQENLFVLQPADMFLHSATHLFHEGDFEKGLRDLFDLDALLREFGALPGFWDQLVPRAIALGLTRPLHYALRFTALMLQTPIPRSVVEDAARVGSPSAPIGRLMDACYTRALRPVHSSTHSPGTSPARFALYVRSHWVRMPFPLLAYHLGRKALMRPKSQQEDQSIADADKKA